MSEQAQSQQPPSQDKAGPDTSPPRAAAGAPARNPLVNLIASLSITQMTLAVLVVVFLWQWFDAHSQINQVQQEYRYTQALKLVATQENAT